MLSPLLPLVLEAVFLAVFVACCAGWGVRILSVVLFAIVLVGTDPQALPLVLLPGGVLLGVFLRNRPKAEPTVLEPPQPSQVRQARADQQVAQQARDEALTAAHGELERHHACVVRLESLR